jgi:hypothetical protein
MARDQAGEADRGDFSALSPGAVQDGSFGIQTFDNFDGTAAAILAGSRLVLLHSGVRR